MVGQLLRDIGNYRGTFVVQSAFRISPLLFQRPGEIRQLLWSDIDLEAKEWRPYISKTDFLRIPVQSCHLFQTNTATHSISKLPLIPVNVATLWW
jgi:integrase